MNKYQPLEKFLENKATPRVYLSFDDIESIIGEALPASARKHRAWWSNNPNNSVITSAWLAAGFKSSEVNLEGETVVFRKLNEADARPSASQSPQSNEADKPFHPIFGCMRGMITIVDGYDLTQPTDPDWGKLDE